MGGRADGDLVKIVSLPVGALLEPEEHLLLADLGEVELAGVEGLEYLVDAELRRALLEVPALVQLRDEAVLPLDHLRLARRDVVAEQPLAQSIFPLAPPTRKKLVEITPRN